MLLVGLMGLMSRVGVSSFDARCGVGLGRAGLRLRSGAFAPDYPILILVAAYGGCLRIPSGASKRPAHPRPTPHRALPLNLYGRRDESGS